MAKEAEGVATGKPAPTQPISWFKNVRPYTAGDGKGYALHVHTANRGKWDQNESTNVSISKLIIGTKPKPFDLVCFLWEQKRNGSICSKIIENRIGTFSGFF